MLSDTLSPKIPIIAVLLNGRPLTINLLDEKAHAIIEAWFPGEGVMFL